MNSIFEEKLTQLLRYHYNLYHADCIMALLEDDTIDCEEMYKHIIRIENAEKNDIDEYDS